MGFWKRFWLFCNLDKRAFAKVRYELAFPAWLKSKKATHVTTLSDSYFLIKFMSNYLGWSQREAEEEISKTLVYHGIQVEYSMVSKDGKLGFLAKKCPGSNGEWDVERLFPEDEELLLKEYGERVEIYD